MGIIDKVAALIQDDAGRVLLVRTNHPDGVLISPGGCREEGESDEQTLARELREELGVVLVSAEYFGTWTEPAALHPGRLVRVAVYRAVIDGEPTPLDEVTELVWADRSCTEQIGSVMRDHVIPAVTAQRS